LYLTKYENCNPLDVNKMTHAGGTTSTLQAEFNCYIKTNLALNKEHAH